VSMLLPVTWAVALRSVLFDSQAVAAAVAVLVCATRTPRPVKSFAIAAVVTTTLGMAGILVVVVLFDFN